MTVRTPFAADARAGVVSILEDFRAATGATLQVYRARPRSIQPPTAFVDSMSEAIDTGSVFHRQREVRIDVLVVFGLFDQGDTVDQRDAFVDAFLDFVFDRYHAAGPDTTLQVAAVNDDPTYVPDWVQPQAGLPPRTYYATRFVLEGYIGNT